MISKKYKIQIRNIKLWYGMVWYGCRREARALHIDASEQEVMGPGFGLKAAPRHEQKKCYLHPKAIESAGRGVSSCQANNKYRYTNLEYKK